MTQQRYATRGGGPQTPAAVCTLRRRDDGTLEVASASEALGAMLAVPATTLEGAAADDVLPRDLVLAARQVLEGGRARQVELTARERGPHCPMVAVVVPNGEARALCTVVETARTEPMEFESIVENAPDIIARIDRELRHAYVNLAIEEATGRPRDEFIGKDHVELGMPDELVQYFQSVYRKVFETGEESRKDFDFPTPHGVRSYSSRVVPERGPSGRVETVLSVARDVTDQKRALAERVEMERRLSGRQRLESLGMLAGGVAHDFNNLLQTVLGTASLVRRGLDDDSSARSDLEQIENACLQASDLCRQLLTYAGQQSSSTEIIDVEDVVAESQPLLALSLSKKIVLDFERRGGLPPIRADASQLRQILMNLVINASEAIGNEHGRIHVAVDLVTGDAACFDACHVLPESREPEYVRLSVSDDGGGMEEEVVARIFEPFFSTKFAGRGLGLAATLGIVRGHDGAIGVRSEPGKGTTFQVMLPATEGRPSRSIPVVGAADWKAEATLLVVDDHDAVRHTAARMAEEVGFRTLLARDGIEALEVLDLHSGGVDVVLLDLTMPRLDGAETLQRIRDQHGALPVILMSGYTEADVGGLTREGMTAFLSKPFRPAQLVETLRRALGKR